MRAYNLLLLLYPASFRYEYADQMRPLFARRLRSASGLGVFTLWIATIAEVIGNASAVHLDILRQDLSYITRALRRSPGFAVTATLVVALGIGATTAAFSVTDFVLLRPLPFPAPDRLVTLWESTPGYPRMELSAPNYRDWIAGAASYASTGSYYDLDATMIRGSEPQRIHGASVSGDLLATLGVAPALGRAFTPADDEFGAPPVLILSDGLWHGTFGGDPNVIGATVTLDDAQYSIVGVMPAAFHFPASDVVFWRTNRFDPRAYQDDQRGDNWLLAVARLRPGVTLADARAEAGVVGTQLRARFPKENKDTGAVVDALGSDVSERSRLLLIALSGAAACVLLIACANLANLLLARALVRRRELAVRTAIGAGRERLVRQLLTESLLLAVVGGALGILIAIVSVPLLAELVPASLPIASAPTVDSRVLLVALALTILTGIAFGCAPVFRAGRMGSLDALRDGQRAGGGRRERLRSALVVAEIAASIVLLVSAGLLLRALLAVQRVDPGFRSEGVLTLKTDLPMPAYSRVSDREALYARVLNDVRALPGVSAAGYVSFLPISSFRGGIWPVSVKGDVDAEGDVRSANNVAALRYATPGFFDALGIPLERGRGITDADAQDRPYVAVVSRSFARRYWPDADPIGRHFTIGFGDREVVGVVGDVRFRGLERTSEPQVYLPSAQVRDNNLLYYAPKDLALRATVPPERLAPAVRNIIRRADPRLPVTDLQTLEDLVAHDTASRSVQVRVLTAFAMIAFVLAAVGIHGLLSFAVSQRLSEIGVRVALGARSRDVVRMVLGRGAALALTGAVPGVLLAYAAGRSMQAVLAGVPPADAPTLAAAAGLSVLMTLLGSLAPTVRALRVDPITALRAE